MSRLPTLSLPNLVLGSLLGLIVGCGGTSPREAVPAHELLTEASRQAHLTSFDQIWETIRDTHYDPDLNGVDWQAQYDLLRPRVEAAKTESEARAPMNALLASLGQSHFAVLPGDVYEEISGEAAEQENRNESSSVTVRPGETAAVGKPRNLDGDGTCGFEILPIDNRAIVSRVITGSPAASANIQLGWELVSVDGRPIAPTFDRFAGVGAQGEMALMLRHSIRRRLKGDPGEQLNLTFADGRDVEKEVTLTLGDATGFRQTLGHMPAFQVDWWIERRGDLGYFYLTGFFNPGPVRNELEAFIAENPDLRGFIIDLRGNPGGIGFMANGLAGLFVSERNQSLGTMISRDMELNFGIYPQAIQFEGPLAVLIDGASASTSEIMAAGLQDLGRARIFGTNTAGAALPSTFVRLPNGDGFQYAIANYVSAGGGVIEGTGVAPDEVVEPDRESLLRGVDPVIESAKRWIAESSGS